MRYAVPWPTAYLTVANPVEAEITVKRSRFRCRLERVTTEDEARAVIEAARKAHWDARHHCSAFITGAPPHVRERSSDDGEPAGTAGAPILDVLRGRHTSDIVAVVTRWFGGTPLGAGGLVRAYGGVVADALDAAQLVRREERQTVFASVPAADAGRIENGLRAAGFPVISTAYEPNDATLEILISPGDHTALGAALARLTGTTARLVDGRLAWRDVT